MTAKKPAASKPLAAAPAAREVTDRHRGVRVAAKVFATVVVVVAAWLAGEVNRQVEAVENWTPVDAFFHNTSIEDVGVRRKRRVRFRAEWGVAANYSYTFDGQTYESSSVWYYGVSTGLSHKKAAAVVAAFVPNQTHTVYVNPARPAEAIMQRELWFRPYSALLFLALASFAIGFLLLVEYDWAPQEYSSRRFPPSVRHAGWFHLHSGTQRLRAGNSFVAPLALLAGWHAVGVLLWQAYRAKPNVSPPGLTEEVIAYHLIGTAAAVRLAHLWVQAQFFGDATVFINTPMVALEGEEKVVRFRVTQDARRNLEYTKVTLGVLCGTVTQRERNNKASRQSKTLVERTVPVVEAGHKVAKGETLDATAEVTFEKYCSKEIRPRPNVRQWIQWAVTLSIRVKWLPFTYSLTFPVVVYDHRKPAAKPAAASVPQPPAMQAERVEAG